VHLQASAPSPQCLPLRHSLPLHPQRRGGLEASPHCEAHPDGHPAAAEGRAQHRESRPIRTAQPLQKRQEGLPVESESLRRKKHENDYVIDDKEL